MCAQHGHATVWTFSEKLRGLKGLNNRAQGETLGPGSLVDGGLKGREKRSIPVPMPAILVSDPYGTSATFSRPFRPRDVVGAGPRAAPAEAVLPWAVLFGPYRPEVCREMSKL